MITIHEWQIGHAWVGLLLGGLVGSSLSFLFLIGSKYEDLIPWTIVIPSVLGAVLGPFIQVVP